MPLRRAVLILVVGALVGASATPALATRGLVPVHAPGAVDLGASRARNLSVTLVLASRDAAGLRAFLRSTHAPLSSHEFNSRFAPARAAERAVRAWARGQHVRVVSVSRNRTLVRLSAPPAILGRALGTHFDVFRSPVAGRYVSATRAARLPHGFAHDVSGIVGLSKLGRASLPKLRSRTAAGSGPGFPGSYGPQDLAALYGAGASSTGAGQTVAVIAEGDVSQPQRDLVTFEQRFGLPLVPWTTIRVGAASADTAGNDEWDLDTQYSTGLAPNVAALHVYAGASLSNDDILATINRWVTDNSSRQASFSAGECESLAWLTGFTDGLDAVLAQAQAQGQTLFTSSGDTGSFCPAGPAGVNGVPAGLPGVEYPAASPGAIGVGGTTVLGSGPNEVAWYAGGGGSSYFEPTPSWQTGAGGSFTGVQRGVPDVALDADPNSGYRVIVNGTEETIGGTSASAPAWQGIWARAQAAHGGSLGFAGPVIYGTEPASAFHDVVVGHQGIYPATPGWDYTTGRGSASIAAFVAGA